MNFDGFGYHRKTRLPDFQLIEAVGQALHVQTALIAGRQSVAILIRLADDLNGCSYAKTVRIGHFKAQLTAIALAKERQRAEEENELQISSRSSPLPVFPPRFGDPTQN